MNYGKIVTHEVQHKLVAERDRGRLAKCGYIEDSKIRNANHLRKVEEYTMK